MLRTLLVLWCLACPIAARAGDPLEEAAVQAWQRLVERGQAGHLVSTGQMVEPQDDPNAKEKSKMQFFIDGDRLVEIIETISDDGTIKETAGKLFNERGAFKIVKGKGGRWMLTMAEKRGSARANAVAPVKKLKNVMVPGIQVLGTNWYSLYECPYAEFSNWQEIVDNSGKRLVRFHASLNAPDGMTEPGNGEFDVTVDPENEFVVVSEELKFGNGVIVRDQRFYDEPFPNPIPSRIETDWFTPENRKTERFVATFLDYSNDPPDPEVFELSYYGIEDVEFASEPSYWWVYALGGVVAAVCLIGYVVLRKKRS